MSNLLSKKKGQVTIYVIIGIFLLASVFVYIYFYTDLIRIPDSDVNRISVIAIEPASIRDYVQSCIYQTARPLIYKIAENGGTFDPDRYGFVNYDAVESYKDNTKSYMSEGESAYTYSCHWEQGHDCVSNLITRQTMQAELNQKILENIKDCLDLSVFEGQGYEYSEGDMKISTNINVDDVLISLDYPLVFTQGENELEFIDFSSTVDLPLGRLVDLSIKITNDEIELFYFDPDDFMLNHGTDIKIYKHKPYPDIIYQLATQNLKTNEILRYNFALQGHDTAAEIGEPRPIRTILGYCYYTDDSNCYSNSNRDDCLDKGGSYSESKPDDCRGVATFSDFECTDGLCNSCETPIGTFRHGESWCDYDSIAYPGFDFVGSRHFFRSCVDGEIFYEECRDYREEICVSWPEAINPNLPLTPVNAMRNSVCKPNNWQECVKQTSKQSCEAAGDCYWSDWLYKPNGNGYYIDYDGGDKEDTGILYADDPSRPYSTRKCIPLNPPGFKHWKGDGAQVCAMANQLNDGDYASDQIAYVENANAYCFFLGDCGNYFNFADQYTAYSFFNSDLLNPEEEGLRQGSELFTGLTEMADLGIFAHGLYDDPERYPILLDGNEFTDVRDSFGNALSQSADFWNYAASQYTKDNFEDHIMDEHIMKLPPDLPVTIHYGVRHVSLCNVWTAPQNPTGPGGSYSFFPTGGVLFMGQTPTYPGSQMCSFCNSDAEDEHRPCSEYRCRSLGQGCVFGNVNGKGVCEDADPFDVAPPEIEVELLTDDMTIESDTLHMMGPTRVFEGSRICHNSCDDDNGITDGIEPYSNVELKMKFSEPTQCSISYFPSYDYRGIPLMFVTLFMHPIPVIDNMDISAMFGSEFKDEIDVSIPVYPKSQLTRDLFQSNTLNTMLELSHFPDEFEQMLVSMTDAMNKVSEEIEGGFDASVIEEWVQDYYELKPRITETFESARGALNLVLSQQVQGNTVLFFDCIDRSGNPNKDFFLKFTTGKDKTPAKLLYAEPADGLAVDKNYQFKLYLNEPAECSFSLNQDADYDNMHNFFDCQTSDIQSLDGTFHCSANMIAGSGENKIFVKCKDQPLPVREYFITLYKTGTPGVADESFRDNIEVVDGTKVNVDLETTLVKNPSVMVNGDAVLTFTLYSDSVCRFTKDQNQHFLEIPAENAFACTAEFQRSVCTATLPVADVDSYVIKCVDNEIYSNERNVNPDSFELTYTN
ncbi:MAG: hypothetical protein ABII01_06380 [Candidatus Woesearchaeota archaeon]